MATGKSVTDVEAGASFENEQPVVENFLYVICTFIVDFDKEVSQMLKCLNVKL